MRAGPERNTFVLQVRSTQNDEWQGTVTWTNEGVSQPFRGILELLRLIDSAVRIDTKETT